MRVAHPDTDTHERDTDRRSVEAELGPRQLPVTLRIHTAWRRATPGWRSCLVVAWLCLCGRALR